ncbi:MAG: hypothetical protein AB7L18_13845 [Hyphomicrobiaceae bacterium]
MAAIMAATIALLVVSFLVRVYLAREQCLARGHEFRLGKGCIAPLPPIILERGLKRT